MAVLIGVLLPVWDYFEAKKLRAKCDSRDRLRYYWIILAAHWLFSAGSIVYLGWTGVLTAGGNLAAAVSALQGWPRIALLVLSSLFALLALAPFLYSLIKPKVRDAYTRAVAKTPFAFIFPRTRIERGHFAVLSVSAGVCEEIIFRSFLVAYLAALGLNVFLALLASSLLFGINHVYQGPVGVIKTGVGGLFFGLFYFSSGSLVAAMVLHALVDLCALATFRPDHLVPNSRSDSDIPVETNAAAANI